MEYQSIPEPNQPTPEVRLGQKFHLFGEQTQIEQPHSDKVPAKFPTHLLSDQLPTSFRDALRFRSYTTLIVDGLPPVSFRSLAYPCPTRTPYGITPFDKNAGYIITQEDFTAEKRVAKMETLPDKLIDPNIAPLRLDMSSVGFMSQITNDPDAKQIARSLRLQVFFPQGVTFEAMPDEGVGNSEDLAFFEFYPFDTGSLPVVSTVHWTLSTGISVALPSDLAKLRQIQGRFRLETGGDSL